MLDLRVSFCGLSRGGVCCPPGEEPAGLPRGRRRRRRPHSEGRRATSHVRGVEPDAYRGEPGRGSKYGRTVRALRMCCVDVLCGGTTAL